MCHANGLGDGGEPLHDWAVGSNDDVDAEVLRDATEASGAVVTGRRLFDIVDGPGGWSDDMGYGAGLAGTPPFFVVTHSDPDQIRLGLDFTFVTDGVGAAIDRALAVAARRDVFVMGGADVVRQCVIHGLADELRIHLAPIVLGGGTRLFSGGERRLLVQQAVRVSTTATHLTYRVMA